VPRPDDSAAAGVASPDDETGSARREALLRRQQLEFALRAGRMGGWELDIASRRIVTTPYCRAIFGLRTEDPSETYEDVMAYVHPEDRAMRQAAVERAIAEHTDIEVEHRILRPDGTVTWVQTRGRAAYEDGQAVRAAGISMDVTERKEAEAHQRLLLDELNHRVKNTLATVQSIAIQTRAGDGSAAGAAFIDRIHALSRAHDLLSEGAWQGASLADVVGRTMAHAATPGRVDFGGPKVRLGPNAAVTLNMAFHELATNAQKYGSLSSPAGRVDVTWQPDGDADVAIDWRESDGPTVVEPVRRGFGSRLIEQALPREMGGEARLVFDAAGLVCHMRLPLSSKLRLVA